ncbi:MAG TPA: hypothetical protein PKY96_14085 [Flavobacteriales bacterium]|nr:hypothetical protein [Flavobacteriales bacterium]
MLRSVLIPSFAVIAATAFAQPRANPAGPDQFICGNATTMQADPLSTGEIGVWTVLQGTANFANQSSPSTLVANLSYGENVLRWTIYAPSGNSSDLVSIFCYNNAMPPANAGPDQTVPPWPGVVQLSGSAPQDPATCFWILLSGTGTISDPTDPQATFSGPGIGTNVLQWSCDNGPCGQSFDSMVIEGVVGIDEANPVSATIRYDAVQHAFMITGANEAMDLMIMDAQGRQMQAARTPAGTGIWKLDALPSGAYVGTATSNGRNTILRFIVAH